MDNEIIERLIEVNEKRSKSIDIKFYIACVLLLFSLVGNIYQATITSEIIVEQKYMSSNHNNNKVNWWVIKQK